MLNVNELFYIYNKIDTSESNTNINYVISIINSMSRLNNLSTFVINFESHKLVYKSERLLYLNEITDKDTKRKCENPYWSLISEDTLEKLFMIREKYPWVNKELSINEFMNHVCVIDFPISVRKHELFVTQKFTPVTLGNDGLTQIGLFTVCHSNKTDIECHIICPSGRRFLFDFNRRRFVNFDIYKMLSPVETAILNRIRKGMTSKEIAQSLCISINTVKTHRMHIFRKLGVNNVSEALVVIGNYQLE